MFIKKFITVVVLVYLYSQMVLCSLIQKPICIRLINDDSTKYVRITNHSILADVDLNSNDPYSILETVSSQPPKNPSFKKSSQSLANLSFTIMGQKSRRYMCFNKRGELKSRPKGNKKLCKFTDSIKGLGYRYTSIYNRNWQVGFNNDGKPMNGNVLTKDKKFRFQKIVLDAEKPIEPNQAFSNVDKAVKKMIKDDDRMDDNRMDRKRKRRRRRRRSTTRVTVTAHPPTDVITPPTKIQPIR